MAWEWWLRAPLEASGGDSRGQIEEKLPPTALLSTLKAGLELGLSHAPSSAPPQAESTLRRRPKWSESTKVPWTTHSGREPIRKGQEVWAAPAPSPGPELQGMNTRRRQDSQLLLFVLACKPQWPNFPGRRGLGHSGTPT